MCKPTLSTPLLALLTVIVILATVPAHAQDGSLDVTFGMNGIVRTDFNDYWDGAYALAIQPDGKLVAAGFASPSEGAIGLRVFALARYNVNGSLDDSFGSGGRVTTDFVHESSSGWDIARALVVQPDGKLVAAGYAHQGVDAVEFALARYNADGSLDASFGSGGRVTGPAGGASALVLQPDGKLVAAGGGLVRYNADGSLDDSFGTGGIVGAGGGALVLQPDGKLVTAGTVLRRFNADGSPDTSFGLDGVATIGFDANALVLQPDGKLVAAGSDGFNSALARYHPDGSLDASFGSGGHVTGPRGPAFALVVQPDGKLVTAGSDPPGNFALVRYHANGSLDASFGTAGVVSTDVSARDYSDEAYALVLQPDGKLVAAGQTLSVLPIQDFNFGLVRYNNPLENTTAPVCGRIAFQVNDGHYEIVSSATDDVGIAAVTFTRLTSNLDGYVDVGGTAHGPFAQGETYLTADPDPARVGLRARVTAFSRGLNFLVTVADAAGNTTVCDPVVTDLAGALPETTALLQAYPNPLRAGGTAMTVPFLLAEAAHVRVVVYDVLGREVAVLAEDTFDAGSYEVSWTEAAGLPSGTYLIRLTVEAARSSEASPVGRFVQTQRVTRLR